MTPRSVIPLYGELTSSNLTAPAGNGVSSFQPAGRSEYPAEAAGAGVATGGGGADDIGAAALCPGDGGGIIGAAGLMPPASGGAKRISTGRLLVSPPDTGAPDPAIAGDAIGAGDVGITGDVGWLVMGG